MNAGRPRKVTEELHKQIIKLREDGETTSKIAEELELNPATVRRVLSRYNSNHGLRTARVKIPKEMTDREAQKKIDESL